jgi:predicted acetyltransferase
VSVTLRDPRSSRDDREWIRSVYRDYLSELSVSKSGLFPALGEWDARESEFLAGWYADVASHPFVILSHGERVGFALVSRRPAAGAAGDRHRLSEFFVVTAARRRGIGSSAAALLFNRFAGEWEIVEDEHNRSALAFWRSVISSLTDGHYRETREGGEVRHLFQVGARPTPHRVV